MVAYSRKSLIRHLPPAGAAIVAIVLAALSLAIPGDLLETIVWRSGIAAIMPVAQPPLGVTARAILALGGAGLGAAVTWSALYLVFGPGGFVDARRQKRKLRRRGGGIPVVRRADAHPDAPPRRPLSAAADLGRPLMAADPIPAPIVVQPVPADLDLPLAAFDPDAIRPVPMEPVRPVSPLAPAPAPADSFARIETFELPPIVQTRPNAPDPVGPPPSIEALLRRLEQGASRRFAAIAR